MVLSPLLPRSPAATNARSPSTTTTTAANAKSLAVRSSSLSGKPSLPVDDESPASTAVAEPDLAERLNNEERRKYVKGKKLGEGTYATVFLGHLRDDPKSMVAIKKIMVNAEYRDGLSMDAIREIKYLQEMKHPNVIALHSVFSSKDQNLNLVLEFLPRGDLEMLIKDQSVFYGAADIKAWMGMLGRGVWFCHENFVLHRDIKPNNLLIAEDGEVKLADFGLARSFSDPYANMTHQVITRWYRPPELLFGAKHYSGAVDVWSMGTVFAELLNRRPWLPGMSDMNQVELINQEIGTPTEANWPGVSRLRDYVAPERDKVVPVQGKGSYESRFQNLGSVGADLLMAMVALDPRKRFTAKQVLQHEWWTTEPRPRDKKDLPKKAGGAEKMGDDLSRRGGEVDDARFKGAARQLDFSSMR